MRTSRSWLRLLFGRTARARRGPPRPATPVAPTEAPAADPLAEPPAAAPAIDAGWDEDVDEDDWGEAEEEEAWDDEPDPFIRAPGAPAETAHVDLRAVRAYARMQALGGEHRISLSSPAGPGSLAEALNRLVEEGLVEAEFVEDDEHGPHILYRPAP